jgi:hypothetical protein
MPILWIAVRSLRNLRLRQEKAVGNKRQEGYYVSGKYISDNPYGHAERSPVYERRDHA